MEVDSERALDTHSLVSTADTILLPITSQNPVHYHIFALFQYRCRLNWAIADANWTFVCYCAFFGHSERGRAAQGPPRHEAEKSSWRCEDVLMATEARIGEVHGKVPCHQSISPSITSPTDAADGVRGYL